MLLEPTLDSLFRTTSFPILQPGLQSRSKIPSTSKPCYKLFITGGRHVFRKQSPGLLQTEQFFATRAHFIQQVLAQRLGQPLTMCLSDELGPKRLRIHMAIPTLKREPYFRPFAIDISGGHDWWTYNPMSERTRDSSGTLSPISIKNLKNHVAFLAR
jgi:hypothetical protein